MDSKYTDELRSKRVIELAKVITDRLNQLGLPEHSAQQIFDSLVDGLNEGRSFNSVARLHREVMDSLVQPPWE